MKLQIVIILITLIVGVLADSRDEVIQGIRTLSGTLYQKLIGYYPNQNVIFSPMTVETLMSLLLSACLNENHETVTQMRSALSLPYGNANREAAFKEILEDLNKYDDDFKVFDATKIYFKPAFTIQPWYRTTAQNVYRSDIETINFANKRDTANTINQWVAGRTGNKITNFIDFYDIPPNTRNLLINTLYLSGKWTKPFLKENNVWLNFYGPSGARQVEMMKTYSKSYYYYEDNIAQYLKLEMVRDGGNADMVFVLPTQRQGLSQLEYNIHNYIKPVPFTAAMVNVTLPKFSFSSNLKLTPVLQNLGVQKLFTFGAKLDGLKRPGHPFTKISDVLQKAFIEVNEWGVTATAATETHGIVDAVPLHRDFLADHPFLFYIAVEEAILFAGRVMQV